LSTRNKLHLRIFIAAFSVGYLFGKLISYNKLQLSPAYICSLSHSYNQLFYRLVCVSKRLRQQMEQPSVMTFQMRYEFFWKTAIFCICVCIFTPRALLSIQKAFVRKHVFFLVGLLLFLCFINKTPG